MKVASIAEVESKLGEYISKSKNEAVIITKNGKPTAALISINSKENLERVIINNSKTFEKIVEKSKRSKAVPEKEFWNEVWQGN